MHPRLHPPLQPTAPRQFISPAPAAPILPGPGLPGERQARIAARLGFVTLRQCFIDALLPLETARAGWLLNQVRHAREPVDLWLLRGAVFSALPMDGPDALNQRQDLQRALENLFPDGGELAPYVPLIRS